MSRYTWTLWTGASPPRSTDGAFGRACLRLPRQARQEEGAAAIGTQRSINSKLQAQSQLNQARILRRADGRSVEDVHVGLGLVEIHTIGQVERLKAELQGLRIGKAEAPRQACV